jgi:hypothetical protein
MPLIFQYGSNCNTGRLNAPERLAGAAEDRGRAQTIDEFDLRFDVWSQGNGCAASDLVPARGTGQHAWGVLYEVPADRIRGRRTDGQKTLMQIEGRLYEEKPVRVRDKDGHEVEEPVPLSWLSTATRIIPSCFPGLRPYDGASGNNPSPVECLGQGNKRKHPMRDRTRVKSACYLAGQGVLFYRCHSDLSARLPESAMCSWEQSWWISWSMISRSTRRILKITSIMEQTGHLAPRGSRAL